MKNWKKVLGILLSVALLAVAAMPACADEAGEEIFVISEDGKTLLGLTDYGKTLEHVDIPAGIEIIGKDAFVGQLSEDPEAPSVPSAIQTVSIPDTVTEIGQGAFAVSGLTEVVIPDSVVTLNTNCFQGSASLASVQLSGKITAIPEAAFAETAIAEIEIPEGVTSIGVFAFGGCRSLKQVKIAASVQSIDEAAFVASGVEVVIFAEGTQIASIHPAAFAGCEALKEIHLPESAKDALTLEEGWNGAAEIIWDAPEA